MNTPEPPSSEPAQSEAYRSCLRRFWARNIRLMLCLLAVWAFAGLGCGILFAAELNEYRIGGYPLGFWFAQQGSIIVFVLVILAFCLAMNRRDRQHHEELETLKEQEK